jgi:hypothetical protein
VGFLPENRIVAFLLSHAEFSSQFTFATFPSPHFPRATATFPQHEIALFHAPCTQKLHDQKVCNLFSPPCDFQVQGAWNWAIPYTLKTPCHTARKCVMNRLSQRESLQIALHLRTKLYRGC